MDCQSKSNCDLRKIYPKDGYVEKGISPNLLMVATDRITGIECPKLWENQTPHYWDLAWKVAKDLPAAAQDKVGWRLMRGGIMRNIVSATPTNCISMCLVSRLAAKLLIPIVERFLVPIAMPMP